MRTFFLAIGWLLSIVLAMDPSQLHAETLDGLKAGAARIDITPDKPVQMSGYASRKDLSTGVHDPLSGACARVSLGKATRSGLDGYHRFLREGTADYLRKALQGEFQLEPSELFLAAIHTHAGPSLTLNKAGPSSQRRVHRRPSRTN